MVKSHGMCGSSKSTMGNGKSPVWKRVAIFTASGGLCLMNVYTFIFQMSGFGVEILDIFGGVG